MLRIHTLETSKIRQITFSRHIFSTYLGNYNISIYRVNCQHISPHLSNGHLSVLNVGDASLLHRQDNCFNFHNLFPFFPHKMAANSCPLLITINPTKVHFDENNLTFFLFYVRSCTLDHCATY